MTRRQIAVFALAMLLAMAALVSIPFLQLRADRQDRARAAQVEAASRARAAQEGQRLLHRFDCTYGRGLKLVIVQVADSADRTAQQTHLLAQAQRSRGVTKAANASETISRQQRATAATLRRINNQLTPLDGTDHSTCSSTSPKP